MHDRNTRDIDDAAAERLWVRRIQAREAGWREMFGQLLARHHGALYRRCLAYLKHSDDAADAAQEALYRACRAIGSFNGDAAFRTWLFAIADNECHTLAHKRARLILVDDLDTTVRERGDAANVEDAGDSGLEWLVHRALGQMPLPAREVLQLRYFAELSIEDIARTLGIGVSATKMRLYRARDQAAALLQEQAFDCAA